MRYHIITLFSLLLASCLPMQQAHREASQINADNLAKAHISHVEYLQRSYAQLQDTLTCAVRAEWHAEVECDACEDESLLPPDTALPSAEFAELMSILQQARPIDPLPADKLFVDTRYIVDEHGEVVPTINIHPARLVACGGIFADLCFCDASGNIIHSWSLDAFGKASAGSDYNKTDDFARPRFILPDAAYNRLLALPTGAAFRAEVQNAVNHSHAVRSRKN